MQTPHDKSIFHDTSTPDAEDLAYAGLGTKPGDPRRWAGKVIAAAAVLATVITLACYAYMTVLTQIAHVVAKARMNAAVTSVAGMPTIVDDTHTQVAMMPVQAVLPPSVLPTPAKSPVSAPEGRPSAR